MIKSLKFIIHITIMGLFIALLADYLVNEGNMYLMIAFTIIYTYSYISYIKSYTIIFYQFKIGRKILKGKYYYTCKNNYYWWYKEVPPNHQIKLIEEYV